jgi:GNAT superfamily N-acetyltransferase
MIDVSMCNQEIRCASLADAAEIASCLSALGYGTLPSLVAEHLGLFAGSATDSVFVAPDSGRGPLLGVVSVHLLPLFHAPGLLGRITALAVKAEARGKGVGKALVAAAEAWAWGAGAQRMEVTSGDHRPDAHMFYQAVGYSLNERRFIKHFPAKVT